MVALPRSRQTPEGLRPMKAPMNETPSMTLLLRLSEAAFGYAAARPVVRVDHLQLQAGLCLGIFGPNGAGKTTLVRGVTGLLPPVLGTVERPPHIGFAYMPQQRSMELQWPMSGFDVAAIASSARSRFGWVARGATRAAILASLRRLGVDDLADRPFAQLSGGQQQRILLAGAIVSGPQVLVLDEPTDGLDVASTRRLLDVVRDLTATGLCTVVISHEVEDLLYLAHDVAWLHPADAAGEPSRVEVIAPSALAARVTAGRVA